MITPTCEQCTNSTSTSPPSHSDERDASPNLKVILGVVGGMALVLIVVFVAVPCVRRYKWRRGDGGRPTADIESSGSRRSRWGLAAAGSRKSSARQSRHHHHGEEKSEPDGLMQPLLPELSEVSTFTWSDLRPSKHSSVESVDELDVADVYSLPTNNATLSHRSTGHSDRNTAPSDHPYSVLGGHSGSAKRRRSTGPVPPSAKRSLSPPGLPSKTASSPNALEPYNIAHELLSPSHTGSAAPIPTISLPSSGFGATEGFANTLSDKALPSPGVEMQPVSEGDHVSSTAGLGSRPASLQLPSPPASPPYHDHAPLPPLSRSRSTAQSHSRSNSQQLADWRFANAQRPRPPLSSALSAPTSLPFRPPPPSRSHGSSSAAWWASPTAQRTGPSSATPALTTAFQSPLSRSGSQSTGPSELQRNPSTLTKSPSPIPETSVYHVPPRSRTSSTVSERPPRVPQGARPKPVDMLRQASGSSSRSARRASLPVSPLSPPSSYVPTPSTEDADTRRAYLRSNASLQTPRIEEPSHTPEGQSVAPSYFDHRPHMPQSTSGLSNYVTPVEESTPTSKSTSPKPADYAYNPPSLHEFGSSRRSSVSSAVVPGPTSSRSRQPAFVRREESQALRPMPATALLHSPPHSPPKGTLSRSGSTNYAIRSRSGSASGAGVLPPSSYREGSDRDKLGRNASTRAVLPPVERLPPMDFGSFDGSPGHERGDK